MSYDTAIKDRARLLYQHGYSYRKIAETLNMSRAMTIVAWKKKYGWVRTPDSNSSIDDEVKAWQSASNRALNFVLNYKVKSVSEAVRLIKLASFHIAKAKHSNTPKTDPGDKVLAILSEL